MILRLRELFKKLLARKPAWVRTNDMVGHRPTRVVRCHMCRRFLRRGYPMLLRNSKLMISKVSRTEKDLRGKKLVHVDRCYINRMNYKCPRCEWVAGFFHPDTEEYINLIFKMRGCDLFYPEMEEWALDKIAREKLEALGYM